LHRKLGDEEIDYFVPILGSHPENVKESESSSMKQKFGSQEVLNVCDQDVVLIDSDYPKVEFGDGFENESISPSMLEESLFRGGGVTERGALRLSSLLAGFGGINVSLALVITSFVDVG
jgi:hypothetical protein